MIGSLMRKDESRSAATCAGGKDSLKERRDGWPFHRNEEVIGGDRFICASSSSCRRSACRQKSSRSACGLSYEIRPIDPAPRKRLFG